jgi:hypothetical protein
LLPFLETEERYAACFSHATAVLSAPAARTARGPHGALSGGGGLRGAQRVRELVTEAGAQAERAGQLERAAGAAAARLSPFAARLARASALHANLQDRCERGRLPGALQRPPTLPAGAAALWALTSRRPAAASPGSAHARALHIP